mmetsp:Transcript_118620/g.332173  ORF Transcript_118620/g.332173 Transcript_118620/m.332173 type:complete len:694 (+) Transcript_118620:65-2146(+)
MAPVMKKAGAKKSAAKEQEAASEMPKAKKRKTSTDVQEDEAEAPKAKKTKAPKEAQEAEATPAKKPKAAKKAEEAPKTDANLGTKHVSQIKGLTEPTLQALKKRGIESLFEVQHRAFGPALSGKDTVGRAKTGCGKTLAFVLPVIERIVADGLSSGERSRKPLMLALAPTRELAKQIFTELNTIGSAHNLAATCLYGGTAFGPQCDELRAGLDAVVATPGRLLDHIRRQTINLQSIRFIVLDEADEMLSMGFQDDVEDILSNTPKESQKLLFSATMPKWVQTLISKYLQKDHAVVDVVGEGNDNQANMNITHQCISCSPFERGETLADLCKVHAGAFGKTLVFTDTKKECDELAQNATLVGMGAGILHGDIPQNSREVTMENFRNGKIKLLLATDVAARGLDVPNVDLVVMTHPPQDLDTYVHRSGRTARGGRTGTCVVFYSRNEEYLVRMLQRKKGIPFKRRGPPQPTEIIAQAARDAVRQVDTIHQDNVEAFTKVAEELLAERGSPTFLLAACLAAMTGYTDRIKYRSLLSSFEGSQALLIHSDQELEQPGKAWYLLRQIVPEEVSSACKGMALVKGCKSAIFDCPQDMVNRVLKAECWKGVSFSVATELPELMPHWKDAGNTAADDEREHADSKRRRWERINSFKSKGKGGGKGDDGFGKGKGRGKGDDGGKGRGKGKSGGRGRGRGSGD